MTLTMIGFFFFFTTFRKFLSLLKNALDLFVQVSQGTRKVLFLIIYLTSVLLPCWAMLYYLYLYEDAVKMTLCS